MGIESTFFPSLYFFNGAGCNPTLRPKPADKKITKPVEKKPEIKKEVPKVIAPNYMALYKQGVAAYEKGKIRLAVHLLQQVIALKKDFAEAYYYLGVCFYCNGVESGSQNDHKNALSFLNQAIALNKRYAKAYFARSQVYFEMKFYREALKDSFYAGIINPKYFNFSSIDLYHKKIAKAMSSRIKIVRDQNWVNRGVRDFCPQNIIHEMIKIDKHVCTKEQISNLCKVASEMLMLARATLSRYSSLSIREKIEVVFYIIFIKLFSIKFFPQFSSHTLASDLSQKVLDCDTSSFLLKIILSELKEHFTGKFNLVPLPEHFFLRYTDVDGKKYNFDWGVFYSDAEYKFLFPLRHKAINNQYYLQDLSLECERALLLSNRGLMRFDKGLVEESVTDYKKAISLYPRHNTAYVALSVSLVALKRYQQALLYSQKAMAMDPFAVKAYIAVATSMMKMNQFDKALTLLGQALKLPQDPHVKSRIYHIYGEISKKMKNYNSALNYMNLSIELSPRFWHSFYLRGKIYFLMGRYEKAEIDLSNILSVYIGQETTESGKFLRKYYFNELIDAFYMLGYCLFKEKKYDEAVAKLKKLLSLDPKNEKAYYLLAQVLYSQGKYQIAREYFRKLIRLKTIYTNDPLLRNIEQKLRVK